MRGHSTMIAVQRTHRCGALTGRRSHLAVFAEACAMTGRSAPVCEVAGPLTHIKELDGSFGRFLVRVICDCGV
jgi:hypothetical protein